MMAQREIWECDGERTELWASDSSRAAMLAYLEVLALWHEQVTAGIYWGVPALHRLPTRDSKNNLLEFEPSTLRSRPARYNRDESAGSYTVPAEVRSRWLAVA